ncbi:MAG: hypothetical protein RLZZ360_737 [Candidatus Parcubacteria bacterium]|jgi:hypothetical protein
MSIKRLRYLVKAILTSLAVSFFIAVLLLLENGYFDLVLKKIGVYPVSEAYTALFFVDAETLADDFDYVKNLKKFTFGIYNHENADQNYSFSVDVYAGEKTIPITKGNLYVKPGETVNTDIELDVDDYPKNSIVYVTLPSHQKSIDFKIK